MDLNRNFITKTTFQEKEDSDPNAYGYMNFYSFMNPEHALDWTDEVYFWVRAIKEIVIHGLHSLKTTVVTGNYHFPGTLFYGYVELQAIRRFI